MDKALRQTFTDAFDDIADALGDTAVFSGIRRETGASESRTVSHSVRCTVSEAAPSDQPSNSLAQTFENQYTVDVGRNAWPDHLPPQTGDSVQFEGYPLLRIVTVLPAAYGWSLACRSKGAAQ